jgi:choline dehydrogenase-like flavoprotein
VVSLDGVEGTLRADVCIVGCGAAGLTLAHALRGSGLSVVALESGPVDDPDELNAGEVAGHPYNGLLRGRVRGLGGTTAVWPGQCMRLRPGDLAAWPFDLDPWYRKAEELLGVPPGELLADPWQLLGEAGPELDRTRIETATGIFCRERRLASLDVGETRILAGAIATRVEPGRVEVRDLAGRTAEVEADAVVLAPGTIETLRLMLVSGLGGDDVGRTFEDHAFAEPARVVGAARPLQDTYGMRLKNGLRYYPKLLSTTGEPGCMANVVFHYPESSGLEAALRVRRALRTRARPALRDVGLALRGLPELAAGGVRVARGREPAPPPSDVRVLTIVEQSPNAASRLELSDALDPLGVPRAKITWELGERERASMATFVAMLDEELRRTGAGHLEVESWLDGPDWQEHAFDAFHPGGGARIGSVVDERCEVRGAPGVYVCGAATFPRAGCVNPTLTIVALAFRLAEHLRR